MGLGPSTCFELGGIMDHFSAHIVAQTRTDEFVRDAEAARQAGLVQRRVRDAKTAPPPTPRPREITRPATA
jgi:hypothetical protein